MKLLKDFRIHLIIVMIIVLACNNPKQTNTDKTLVDSLPVNSPNTSDKTNLSLDTIEYLNENKLSGIYAYVSSDSLKDNDLLMIPPSELRLMRNEIFARHGYKFKSQDLQQYFKNKHWYKGLFNNVNHRLSDKEKYNIGFIKRYEKNNKEISQKEQFGYYVKLINDNKQNEIPKALGHKYGLTAFDKYPYSNGYVGVDQLVFKQAEKNIFLIYTRYLGCNECPYQYELRKFDLEGNELKLWELGNDLEIIEMQSDTILYCYGVNHPYLSFGDETTEIKPEDIDTIRHIIKITDSGKLIFE